MGFVDSLLMELEQEGAKTLRLLERVPADKSDWAPHPTSLTLGYLAHHVATIPGVMADYIEQGTLDIADAEDSLEPGEAAGLPALFESNLERARSVLSALGDAGASAPWTLTKDGKELMSLPNAAVARGFLLNHLIHHRGQLCVYLRMLGVPIPAIYGPSADEHPFPDA